MIDIVFPDKNEKKFLEIADKLGIELCFAYKNKNEFIGKFKNVDINIVKFKDRASIEKKPDIVFGFEFIEPYDSLHYRRSGLSQVLCKLANEKEVALGIPFSMFNSVKHLGRLKANAKMIQKYKNKMILASFANSPYEMRAFHELLSFAVVFGFRPENAKKGLNNLELLIEKKRKQKEGKLFKHFEIK